MPATEAPAAVRRPTAIAIASSSSRSSGGIARPARSRYPPAGPVSESTGGYGHFLEQSDPGLRKRMAQSSAPEGFEDVVATLSPIADNQPDAPAHWSVTFAVDDADATAERAAKLGGEVVVSPFDAPWVRMTVITDPQGATFTASKFVPENKYLGTQADPAVRAA
jgi:hypothetical protein